MKPAMLILTFVLAGLLTACSSDEGTAPVYTDFSDTFDGEFLDGGKWSSTEEFTRSISGGALTYRLAGAEQFVDSSAVLISVDPIAVYSLGATITVTTVSQTGDTNPRARLGGRYFHTPIGGEAPGNRMGDIGAELALWESDARYIVWRCLTELCDGAAGSIEVLTDDGAGGAYISLGAIAPNTATVLDLDWNNTNADQFTFSAGAYSATYDPGTAGYANTGVNAYSPARWIGPRISGLSPGESADITSIYDDIQVNGAPYDSFTGQTYLHLADWSAGSGKIDVVGGELIMEAGQEFSGDLAEDDSGWINRLVSAGTSLSVEAVAADVTILTADLVDSGVTGPSPDARAYVELGYQPLGITDSTDFFGVRVELRAVAGGTYSVAFNAFGCINSDCSTSVPQSVFQEFPISVAVGTVYRLRVQHLGGGMFQGNVNGGSAVAADFSSVAAFGSSEFRGARLSARARRANDATERAFIRASFDNVVVGSP